MTRVPVGTHPFTVQLQRSAFGPRLVARAGDVWRAMQDVVVDESSSVGWPPERYVAAKTMFVVRSMTVRHEREVRIGERLVGHTWPSRARRDMLFTREVRLFASDEPVASATQEWAYLSRELTGPIRAGRDIYDAFTIHQGFPTVELPTLAPATGPVHRFVFRAWHTWMDALAHVNHPAYVDFCDESTARAVAAAGLDPHRLAPVAEAVHFRAAIAADVEVTVETQLEGHAAGSVLLAHRLLAGQLVCATAHTVRRLVDEPGTALFEALSRSS